MASKHYVITVEAQILVHVYAGDEVRALNIAEEDALNGEGEVTEALAVDIAEVYKAEQHGGGE